MRQLLKHISPTTVLAAAALFVALAGSSTAAVDNVTALITGAQIKNGSVTGADVKNKSLTAADIKGRLRGPQGVRGPAGPGDLRVRRAAWDSAPRLSECVQTGPDTTSIR